MRPEKMFFLPFLATVSRPCLDRVERDRVDQVAQRHAGLHLPLKRTSTLGMSSGITPVAAAKATRPEPAGKLMPIGKTRVRVAAGADGVGQQQAVEPGGSRRRPGAG